MNFLDLQNLVAYWLDDLSFGYFTPVQVKRWLNNAQLEVWKRLVLSGENYYTKCVQTTLVANQSDYALPDNFAKVARLEIVTNPGTSSEVTDPIKPITLNQQDFVSPSAAQPRNYYLKKNCLIILPPPDITYTMRLYYAYRPGEMTIDNEVADCPEEFREYIALLASRAGRLKDDRPLGEIEGMIAGYESLLKSAAQERTIDGPREITITGLDSSELW